MVVDIQVVADRRTVSIDRKGKILQGIGDEQRNDLLRELVGPVGIGAPRDQGRNPKAGVIRGDQHLGPRLGRRVGAPRRQHIGLPATALLDVTVNLVGADLQEPLVSVPPGGLQQDVRTVDIGLDEGAGVEQRPVDVGFGGKVHDGVNVTGQLVDSILVADVPFDETQTRVAPGFAKVFLAAGIGELVEDGQRDFGVSLEPLPDEG